MARLVQLVTRNGDGSATTSSVAAPPQMATVTHLPPANLDDPTLEPTGGIDLESSSLSASSTGTSAVHSADVVARQDSHTMPAGMTNMPNNTDINYATRAASDAGDVAVEAGDRALDAHPPSRGIRKRRARPLDFFIPISTKRVREEDMASPRTPAHKKKKYNMATPPPAPEKRCRQAPLMVKTPEADPSHAAAMAASVYDSPCGTRVLGRNMFGRFSTCR